MQFETEFYATGDVSTIFVIEGEQVVRSALHYILRGRHRVHTYASLDDALTSAADAPDVVLIGIDVLRSQGEALLSVLAEQFAGAKILIVADRPSDPRAQACLERGAHGIVSKPISFDAVCDAVWGALAAPVFAGEPSRLIRVAFS